MPLLTSILLLLVLSRLFGELMVRLGQPALIGEILAGVVLGPAVLGAIAPTESLAGVAELSVFLIVLSAGLEMDFTEVSKAFRARGLVIATLGFFIPLFSGVLLGVAFRMDATRAIFLGLCMAITALPVAVRILGNFKMLNSSIARYSIGTAVVNDVAALLLLGVILDARASESATGVLEVFLAILKTSAKMGLFALLVLGVSRLLHIGGMSGSIERALRRLTALFGREALFGIAVLFVLIFASISETLGSHFVVGAFFGGLLLSRDIFGNAMFRDLDNTIQSITGGFLAPIFFAFLGLHFSMEAITSPFFVVAVLVVSFVSKYYSGILGGRLVKLSAAEARGIGVILNGRGVMELVVANIALQRGFIGPGLFSTLVLMGILTTLVTPILFKQWVLPYLPANQKPSE